MSLPTKRRATPIILFVLFSLAVAFAFFVGRRTGKAASPSEAAGTPPAEAGAAGSEEHKQEGVIKFSPESLELAKIKVAEVNARLLPAVLSVTGTVEPNQSGIVKVTPRISGKVSAVKVNMGDNVSQGDVLAILSSTQLAEAQAVYKQAQERVSVANTTLNRQRELARLGAFGQPKVEEARAQAISTQAQVETAQSELAGAQAGVAQSEGERKAKEAALTQAVSQVDVATKRLNRADLLLKEELISRQEWEQTQADKAHALTAIEAARAEISEAEAKTNAAKAQVRTAEAHLHEAQKRQEIAARTVSREEAVYKGGFLTSREIVEAEAALRQAQLDERSRADAIRLMGGTPGVGNTISVLTPLSGRVTERLVTLGESVTPEKYLFTIVNLNTVWVSLQVPQQSLPSVRTGQRVNIISDGAPGRTFAATISNIGDVVDETTRTVRVRCVIPNASNLLKPESFVKGTITTEARAEVLAVPKDAVQTQEGKTVVFVTGEHEGEFQPREVTVGDTREGFTIISGGLKAKDRVVTEGAFLVKGQAMKSQLGEHD